MADSKAVQAFIERVCNALHIPGISVVVSENGVHSVFNYGYADLETGKAVTEDSMMSIGSSTKAFCSESLGILADQGKISLGDRVKDYIPELDFLTSMRKTT